LHGVGKNGKSTLVELFQDLMGDYSTAIATQTLMSTRYGDVTAQYQLAVLNGVRFISAAETKKGQELDETVVKHITGGDTITARAPYAQCFTYRPQFKIWMSTNHKPEIPDGSEAIWDRLRLIPFEQRFPGKDADTSLPDKLREELSGVLAWAVQGCLEWVQSGLGSAAAVDPATSAYRAETDVTERFFQDECVFTPGASVTKKGLFEAWENWCIDNGEEAGKQNGFTRTMGERGVVKNFREGFDAKGTRVWRGIGLKSDSTTPPSEKVTVPEKSCKHEGGESPDYHFSEGNGNFSGQPPTQENFSENGKKVTVEEKVTVNGSPPPISGQTWTVDGLEIHYMPEGE
jgi:putative DNA primase/helicase